MPEPRPVQTYSTLLEDRRIIEAAADANEPPSLVVHLLEKEWTISTGKVAHPGPGARRFSYSQPISSLLDDIQARRIPSEFTDIFRKLDVKFFEGCLLVEMHDSRPPVKGGAPKPVEASIAKYVLRPTAESLWADIRNAVDTQKNWGDKEALELEARLVLSTAPPLCLDPSPTVNRIANVVMRSSAYGKASFKRKPNDDTDDDGEIIKRRKLMQLMNPRVGKPFTPGYRALIHKQAPSQKPPAIVPPNASSATPVAPPQNVARPPNGPTAPPAAAPNVNISQQVSQAALQQQQWMARQRGSSLNKVPQDAQQAALAAQSRFMQLQANNAAQQQVAGAQAQVQAQMRAAAGAQAPAGAVPMPNGGQNQPILNNANAAAQLTALQNTKAPFALNLPGVKRPPTAMGSASPPKPTTMPPGAPSAPNGQAASSDTTTVQQTPRMQNATPSNPGAPINPANQVGMQMTGQQTLQGQNSLASYHQNLMNGAQNSMQQMQAYNNATGNVAVAGGIRTPYNYAGQNAYTAAAAMARQAQLAAGVPGVNGMHQQQQIAAYQAQQRMAMAGQQMHPAMAMQMQQAGYGTMQAPVQNQQPVNQVRTAQQQQYMAALTAQANQVLSAMTPDQMQSLVNSRATEQMRANSQWVNSDLTAKARVLVLNILRLQHAGQLAQQQQAAQAG